MARASNVYNFDLRQILNSALGTPSPALAIGTVTSGFNTTNAIQYTIEGIKYSIAAVTSQAHVADATLQAAVTNRTGFYIQPVSSTVYYLLLADASGNIRTLQGTFANQTFTGSWGAVIGSGNVPQPDSTVWAPWGLIKVVTNGSTTFTPGTTLHGAAGVTSTFINIAVVPAVNP
jgi:hypothetical protein